MARIKMLVPFINEVHELESAGKGAYPYDCIAKDEYPDSVIYWGKYGWIPSHDLVLVPEGIYVPKAILHYYKGILENVRSSDTIAKA